MEFWTGPKGDFKFSKNLEWEYKTETDWYEFVKVNVFLSVNMLANFACFLLSAVTFLRSTFSDKPFKNTTRISYSLGLDQA